MLWISWHGSVPQGWGSQRMHFPFLRALFSAIIYSHHPLQFGSLPTMEGSVGRAVIPLLPRISGRWKSQKEKGGNFRFPCLSNFQGDLRSSKWFLDWQGRLSCKRKVTQSIPCGKIFFLWSCGSEWVELEKPHKKSMHELCRLNNTVIGSITPSLNYPQLLGMGTVQVTASAWIPGSRFGTSLSFLFSSSLQKESFCRKIWGGSSWNLLWGDAERDHWGRKGKGSRAWTGSEQEGMGGEDGTTRGWISSTPKAVCDTRLPLRGCCRQSFLQAPSAVFQGWSWALLAGMRLCWCTNAWEGRCQGSSSAWSCFLSTLLPVHELQILGSSSTVQQILAIYTLLHNPLCPAWMSPLRWVI